jgi:replicative superfamily II helicase
LGQLNNAGYIESKFLSHLKSALNAEVVLGNITNIFEALDWLKYTYFYIRFERNPIAYQFSLNPSMDRKLQIEEFLHKQIETVVLELSRERLMRYDEKNFYLNSTELGRITSHFYIQCETMGMFCENLGIMTDNVQVFKNKNEYFNDFQIMLILARAKEFENLKVKYQNK